MALVDLTGNCVAASPASSVCCGGDRYGSCGVVAWYGGVVASPAMAYTPFPMAIAPIPNLNSYPLDFQQ
ncbi:hypothetical protein FD723_41215 (plasmid) [Nostoc sp. C052]|uniref:hypothetical protein n=1 Tax=Nostoc sp. C052 TaxID=2576902 RepID=UPI0015C3DA9C|nr:hypothetical protein [Nostoc sp. C052]QLE46629.1 hypothetical protein FD723_41215 [Nostoc sp. C052]